MQIRERQRSTPGTCLREPQELLRPTATLSEHGRRQIVSPGATIMASVPLRTIMLSRSCIP